MRAWPAVAILCGVIVGVAGCDRAPQVTTVFIAGDSQGWITPCGCAANQSGGLARRATLVTSRGDDAHVLLLDVGGSAVGTTEYQRLKFESLLRGLRQMKLAAMNVGAAETAFAPRELAEIGAQAGITWLSSNLTSDDGTVVTQSLLHVERNSLRIDVVGVIDPELVKNEHWRTADAVPSVLKALDHSTADFKLVLAYYDEGGLRKLAEALPEVDYVIGGPTGQAMSPVQVGRVTVLSATNKGKFLAQLELPARRDSSTQATARIVEVASTLAETPAQLTNLEDYHQRLTQRDFTAAEAGLVEDIVNGQHAIAGSQACRECHAADADTWLHSKHAQAWDVLVAKQSSYDPNCQQCHTTGYGLPGGFVNVASTAKSVHVGCENCHGPSQAHAANPQLKTPYHAAEQCVRCHDHENSPTFEFDPYWAQVTHGQPSGGS